jgi:hypothetical protein
LVVPLAFVTGAGDATTGAGAGAVEDFGFGVEAGAAAAVGAASLEATGMSTGLAALVGVAATAAESVGLGVACDVEAGFWSMTGDAAENPL